MESSKFEVLRSKTRLLATMAVALACLAQAQQYKLVSFYGQPEASVQKVFGSKARRVRAGSGYEYSVSLTNVEGAFLTAKPNGGKIGEVVVGHMPSWAACLKLLGLATKGARAGAADPNTKGGVLVEGVKGLPPGTAVTWLPEQVQGETFLIIRPASQKGW